MYPDSEHFYDEEYNLEFYCPNIHEQKFIECLHEYDVESNDTNNKYYMDCHREKENRYKKCWSENGTEFINRRHILKTTPKQCDKSNLVYTLTRDESNFANKPYNECNRPFVVHKIPNSNLVVLKTNRYCNQVFATDTNFQDVPSPIEYPNKSSIFCFKQSKPQLYRFILFYDV